VLKAPVYVVEIHGFLLEANVCTSISLSPVASTAKIVPINSVQENTMFPNNCAVTNLKSDKGSSRIVEEVPGCIE
jgi:hypothetical protein